MPPRAVRVRACSACSAGRCCSRLNGDMLRLWWNRCRPRHHHHHHGNVRSRQCLRAVHAFTQMPREVFFCRSSFFFSFGDAASLCTGSALYRGLIITFFPDILFAMVTCVRARVRARSVRVRACVRCAAACARRRKRLLWRMFWRSDAMPLATPRYFTPDYYSLQERMTPSRTIYHRY